MSDDFSGKSGKVKVMYVRADENKNKGKGTAKNRQDKDRRTTKEPRWGDSERPKRPVRNENERPARSAWQARLQDVSEPAFVEPSEPVVSRIPIDQAQLRRQREEESKVYGENACLALFKSRPESVIRAYFLQEVTPRFREALRWMAAQRLAYHVVDAEEMQRVSGTEHHGGVCFLIKKRRGLSVMNYLSTAPKVDCVLAVDGIGNPYNLGGIIRTAAHFGIQGIMLRDLDLLESGATVRTAEGGAEYLKAIDTDDLGTGLDEFRRAGYKIVVLTYAKGQSFAQATLPEKMVLILTEDRSGVPPHIQPLVDLTLSFAGTGKVDGLNISVAAGITLADWWGSKLAK